MAHDVFISYKSDEIENAYWIKSVLEINGLSCWMAPDSIPGGSSYANEIEQAIYDCGVFVLLLSEKAQTSIWVEKELSLALSNSKRIFPFMLSSCDIVKPYNFYLTDIERYLAYEDRSKTIKRMILEIYEHLGKKREVNSPSFEETHTGDTVPFGSYYFDNEQMSKSPILWDIVDETDSKLLLISKFCLDVKPYNIAKDQNTSWAESSLRKWLNTSFLNTAFDTNQQRYLCQTLLPAENNPEHTTPGGENTEDKIFILSVCETEKYYPNAQTRKSPLTSYTKAQLPNTDETSLFYKYWLRCPGYYPYRAVICDENGAIDIDGYSASRGNVALRPAMWIYKNIYNR